MKVSVAFWTAALLNLFAIVALAANGIRSIRRGDLRRHRRCMKSAAALVACFLGAYPLKVLFLGRERLGEWSAQDVAILRIHEAFVFAMVVGGLAALLSTRKMQRPLSPRNELPSAPLASSRVLRRHRVAGRIAAICAGLAFLTAAIVLVGMYDRMVGH